MAQIGQKKPQLFQESLANGDRGGRIVVRCLLRKTGIHYRLDFFVAAALLSSAATASLAL